MRPVILVAAGAVLTLAGCNADSVSFQATNVLASSGAGGLNLNDEIAVRFSEELDPASVSAESLRVTDGGGRRLAIRARAANDTVYIAPADPDGWPADTKLVVEVPHPWLGRPIRSAFGAPNDAAFRSELATGRRYGSRSGSLKLLYHSLPFSDGTDVTEDAEFVFEFDGPIDPASIEAGVVLDDLTHGESAPHFAADVVSPRRLSIVPFANQAFRSGTRYRLSLTGALRAEDTRKLGEPMAFVFSTTKSRSGEHTTDFRPDHLVDPSVKPDKGPLTPLLYPVQVVLGQGSSNTLPTPFGTERSKIQILIPGELLDPDEQQESAVITGVSFRVFGAEPASLRLSARLDYASERVNHAGELSREFDQNWQLPPTRQRDLIGAEGEVHVLDPSDGRISFVFPKPFFYDPVPLTPQVSASGLRRSRSLVLEVVNEAGILNDSAGIDLLGETPTQGSNAPRLLEARGNWSGDGQPLAFIPGIELSMQRLRRVVLKPWKTTSVADPEYFVRRQDQIVATPGFLNFRVEYRAFEPGMDPSTPVGYSTDLSELTGRRTIQARIVFLLRSADPLPKDAGLLRLTVPFRERGTE